NDFAWNLCVNQNNVINEHNDFNENTYMIISGPRMKADITLPFTHFQEEATAVGFHIESKKTEVRMSFPASHTLGAYLTDDAKIVGTVGNLILDGTYRYCSTVAPGKVDSLMLSVKVRFNVFGHCICFDCWLTN